MISSYSGDVEPYVRGMETFEYWKTSTVGPYDHMAHMDELMEMHIKNGLIKRMDK